MTVTVPQLEQIANDFLSEHFNLKLTVPIKLNGRLSRSLGRFTHNRKTPLYIEMSKAFVAHNKDEEVIDVFKHELIHYALFVLGKPHKDSDREFQETCKRLGVCLTNTYSLAKAKHNYSCGQGCDFGRQRRLNARSTYRCLEHGLVIYEV